VSKAKHIARIRIQTKVVFIFAELVAAGITLSALVDCVFHLGWSYDWKAVLAGVGLMAWGGVVYLACRTIFKWTSTIYK